MTPTKRRSESRKSSSSQKGKEFENYVCAKYESFGYNVVRDTIICGQQVDIIARIFVEGLEEICTIIECKYRTSGSVSNQEVYDFQHFVTASQSEIGAAHAIMITNTAFSPRAKEAAKSTPTLKLLTLHDLDTEYFNVNNMLVEKIRLYESNDFFMNYIPLKATLQNSSRESFDLAQFCSDEIHSPNNLCMAVSADFGSGKTTFLKHFEYVSAKRHLSNLDGKGIPIFFELRNFKHFRTLDEFIKDALHANLKRDIPIDIFWQFLHDGKLLILLDGFDEISTATTLAERKNSLIKLTPLLLGNSPSIITYRPTTFVSEEEYSKILKATKKRTTSTIPDYPHVQVSPNLYSKYVVPEFQPFDLSGYFYEIHLSVFGETEIEGFLRKFDPLMRERKGKNWREVKKFLYGIYDLKDLMARPILLSMIVDTVLEGDIDLVFRSKQRIPNRRI